MTTIERQQRRGDAAVLRRIWRLHLWVGVFAAPALLVLACSGLVILYSQPLDLWLNRRWTTRLPRPAAKPGQVSYSTP